MDLSALHLPPLFYTLLPFIMLLDLALRGLSMWKSARAGQKWWFIALLVVNTLGILPAVYLILNYKKSPAPEYLPPQPETVVPKRRSTK